MSANFCYRFYMIDLVFISMHFILCTKRTTKSSPLQRTQYGKTLSREVQLFVQKKKVDDRSDNDCEIREITEFFEKTHINILRQFGPTIDIYTCVWQSILHLSLSLAHSHSYSISVGMHWHLLVVVGTFRTKQNVTRLLIDESISENALNAKCKKRSNTHEATKKKSRKKSTKEK